MSSEDIYFDIKKPDGTLVYSNVYMQLDNMTDQEAAYYGGVAPYERYMAYPLSQYIIGQSYSLIDRNNIDPKTNKNYIYRVINIPRPFPDNHEEIVCDLVRGT